MTPVRFRPEVAVDLEEAFQWYEQRQEGLGSSFAQNVDACVTRIRHQPEIYSKVDRRTGVRRGRVERFPYSVMYLVEPEMVVVLAVVHQAREPGIWKQRL